MPTLEDSPLPPPSKCGWYLGYLPDDVPRYIASVARTSRTDDGDGFKWKVRCVVAPSAPSPTLH